MLVTASLAAELECARNGERDDPDLEAEFAGQEGKEVEVWGG